MNNETEILFLGDVVPYRSIKFRNRYRTIINLESPVTKEGKPATGKVNLNVPVNYLKSIFNSNLFCVNLGNNHILDFGFQGLESTINEIGSNGTKWFGVNNYLSQNNNPLIIDLKGIRIAFYSLVCPSTSPVIESEHGIHLSLKDSDEITQSIRTIRGSVDKIVVCIHWGTEESSYPAKADILFGRKLIESGVDVVVGTHPHAPQPVEKYKNGIIAYSLGNFIMPEMKNIPSYFDENGSATSGYEKKIMLWNRISWGLLIDFGSLEYRIKKYILIFNRVIELPFTPLDKYLKLPEGFFNDSYSIIIDKHLKRRAFYRYIRDFISRPHIPGKLKKML